MTYTPVGRPVHRYYRRPRAKRRILPLLWLAFSGGGVLAAVFLPALVFLFAFAFPLDWIDPPDHDHLSAVVGHPLTFLFLLAMFPVLLIHSAHRFRYTLYDGLQIKARRTVAVLCYGVAAAGALAAFVVLVSAL
jgi:fumarate reductase subunit D